MFNLSFGEIIVLSGIGLLVLGPKQLPQAARVLGKTYNEFRKVFQEVTHAVKADFKADNLKKTMTNTIAGAILNDEQKSLTSFPRTYEKEATPIIATTIGHKSIEEVMRELGK